MSRLVRRAAEPSGTLDGPAIPAHARGMASLQCQFCGAPVTIAEPIGREAQCDSCGHDLRCCRNCRHYDPRYNNSCTETMADPVVEKDRRNFCEYFYFNREPYKPAAMTAGREAEARKKLEQMFGPKQ